MSSHHRRSSSPRNMPDLGNGKALALFESFPPEQQLEALHKYGRYLEYLSRRGVEIRNPEAHSLRFMENYQRKQSRQSDAQNQRQVDALVQYTKLLEKLRQKGEEIRNPYAHLHVFLMNFYEKQDRLSNASNNQDNDALNDVSSEDSTGEFQEESSLEGDDDVQDLDQSHYDDGIRLPVSSLIVSGKAMELLNSLPTQESRDHALEWCDGEVFELRNRGEEVINPERFLYHKMRWFIKTNGAAQSHRIASNNDGVASAKPESVLRRLRRGDSIGPDNSGSKNIEGQSENDHEKDESVMLPLSSIVVEGKALDWLNSLPQENQSEALAYCDNAFLELRKKGNEVRNPKQFVYMRMRRFVTDFRSRQQLSRDANAKEATASNLRDTPDATGSLKTDASEDVSSSQDFFPGNLQRETEGVSDPVRLPVSSIVIEGKALELLNSLPTPEGKAQALEWCDGAVVEKKNKGEEILNLENFLCSRIRRFVNETKTPRDESAVGTQRQSRSVDSEELKRLREALEETNAELEQSREEINELNLQYALLDEKYESDKRVLETAKEHMMKFHGEKDLLLEKFEEKNRLLDTRTKEKAEVEAKYTEAQARLEEMSAAFVKVKNELLTEQVARQEAEERIKQLTELNEKYQSERNANEEDKDENAKLHEEIATLKANLQKAVELLDSRTIENAKIAAKEMESQRILGRELTESMM